jgi:hypothetical protein
VERSGRIVSLLAGSITIVLTGILGAALLGPQVGSACALLAAVHTQLVRASTFVLADMLHGLVIVTWALLVLRPGPDWRFAAAAALGAVATTARVEGLVLAPLTLVAGLWQAPRHEWPRRALMVIGAAAVVLVPLLLIARAQTGTWAVSGKEVAIIARKYGVEGTGIVGLVFGHPLAFLRRYPGQIMEQASHTVSVVLLVLASPTLVGLIAPAPTANARTARRLTVLTLVIVSLGMATINPGRRYVTPMLPLLLPWTAFGLLYLLSLARDGRFGPAGLTIGRHAGAVGAARRNALSAHAHVPEEDRWADCFPRVCEWIAARHQTAPALMARDSRLAYVCAVPYVHEPRRASTNHIAATAAELGATVWVLKANRQPDRLPAGVRLTTTLCEGRARLLVYEVAPPGS